MDEVKVYSGWDRVCCSGSIKQKNALVLHRLYRRRSITAVNAYCVGTVNTRKLNGAVLIFLFLFLYRSARRSMVRRGHGVNYLREGHSVEPWKKKQNEKNIRNNLTKLPSDF